MPRQGIGSPASPKQAVSTPASASRPVPVQASTRAAEPSPARGRDHPATAPASRAMACERWGRRLSHRLSAWARCAATKSPAVPPASSTAAPASIGTEWSTPGLVETRFSPDALVWVAVVFHGTAAWRNHGLIIFPLLPYRTSVQLRCPSARLIAGLCPARKPPGAGYLLIGHPPAGAAGSPGWSRVTRSVIACDAGGALDLGGGSAASLTCPARRYPPGAAPVVTCRGISEEGRGPGQRPGGCGRSPPG